MAISRSRLRSRRSPSNANEELLALLQQQYQPTPKANPLERLFAPIRGLGSMPDAYYKSRYKDKNFLTEYLRNVGRGLVMTPLLGKKYEPLKEVSDTLMREGRMLGQSPGDKAGRFAVDLMGSVLTNPVMYAKFPLAAVGQLGGKVGGAALSKSAATAALQSAGKSTSGKAGAKLVDNLAKQIGSKNVNEAVQFISSKHGAKAADALHSHLMSTGLNLKQAGGVQFAGQTVSKSPFVAEALKGVINPIGGTAKLVGAGGRRFAPDATKAVQKGLAEVFNPFKAQALARGGPVIPSAMAIKRELASIERVAAAETGELRALINKLPAADKEKLPRILESIHKRGGRLVESDLTKLPANIQKVAREWHKLFAPGEEKLIKKGVINPITDRMYIKHMDTQLTSKALKRDVLPDLTAEGKAKLLGHRAIKKEIANDEISFNTLKKILRPEDFDLRGRSVEELKGVAKQILRPDDNIASLFGKEGFVGGSKLSRHFQTIEKGAKEGYKYNENINSILHRQYADQKKLLTLADLGEDLSRAVDAKGQKLFTATQKGLNTEQIRLPGKLAEKIVKEVDPKTGRMIERAVTDNIFYTDKTTKRVLENVLGKFDTPTGVDKALHAFDKVLGSWKGFLTGRGPGFVPYQMRNMFDDNLRLIMGGHDIKRMPGNYKLMMEVLDFEEMAMKHGLDYARKHASQKLSSKFYSEIGKKAKDPVFDLWQDMTRRGVIRDMGQTLAETTGSLQQAREKLARGELSKGIVGKWDDFTSGKMLTSKKGGFFPVREQASRGAHYVEMLRKTKNPSEAAEAVFRTMFNYDEMTRLEKETLNRLIPFYTFMRNNFQFQWNELYNNPQSYGKLIHVLDAMVSGLAGPDKDAFHALPDWMKDRRMAMLVGSDEDQLRVLSNFNLSFEELEQTNLPGMLGRLNPLLKMPIELATGYSTFQRRPIEDIRSGNRYQFHPLRGLLGYQEKEGAEGRTHRIMDPHARYWAENIPYVGSVNMLLQKLGRTGGPLIDKDTPSTEAGIGLQELFAPARVYDMDREYTKQLEERKELDELYKLLYRKGMAEQFTRFYIPANMRDKLLRELR